MLILLAVVVVIGGIALLSSRNGNGTLFFYDYDGVYSVKCEASLACPFDVPYINMNYMAALWEMSVSGSYEDMKFSTEDGEWISFIPGSRAALVNGNRFVMQDVAVLSSQQMWLPVSALEQLVTGFTVNWDVERDDRKHVVEVILPKDGDGKAPLPLRFTLRPPEPTETAWDEGCHYLTDMTPYRDAIEPQNRDAYLILVNKQNPLPDAYVPGGLVSVTDTRYGYPVQQMVETAELALQALYQDLRAAGFTDVGVTSGYRSYATQSYLYEKYIATEMQSGISREEAEDVANTYSARPGQSEHQTGLAADMYNTDTADESFANTEAYLWLKEHAHEYGFILRYPKGKESVTGYVFEPWHFRFVGRYHATEMYRSGLTLEEYLSQYDR